ncbi:signal peptidase I [Enemella sp. A6]|uniref:signal peptidase I n=1 Tax=Enemella sp. A6 TaxID=3440152 RepID=UPI003EB9DDD9
MSENVQADEDHPVGIGTKMWRLAREIGLVLIFGLILSVLIRTFVAQVFSIPSGSMENTLKIGDRVVVQKISKFQRGDVVVFSDHAHWLSDQPQAQDRGPLGKALEFVGVLPDTGTNHLIKRVIGLPGDTVECCSTEGRLSVNGVEIPESEYLYTDAEGNMVAAADVPFKVVVPRGTMFVMGDHRNASRDSRCYLSDVSNTSYTGATAFVPTENVVGTAWVIIYPFEHGRFFSTPDAFANVPDPPPAPDRAVIEPEGVGC